MSETVNGPSANGDQNADTQQRNQQEEELETSSAKRFERSRIRALAGINVINFLLILFTLFFFIMVNTGPIVFIFLVKIIKISLITFEFQ